MKSLVFITAIFIGLGLQSCQSEYSERMAKAIELKKKHTEIQNILTESKNPGLKAALNDIEQEIRIQGSDFRKRRIVPERTLEKLGEATSLTLEPDPRI